MDEGAWSFNEAKALNYFYMVCYNAFIWWSDTAISLQALYKAMGMTVSSYLERGLPPSGHSG